MGDCVLFLDCMRRLREHYSKKEGYHIRFAAREISVKFYEKYGECELDEYISIDEKNKIISFVDFYKVYHYLNAYKPDVVLLPISDSYGKLLAVCLDNKRSYCQKKESPNIKTRKLFNINNLILYSFANIIPWEANSMAFDAYRVFLYKIGVGKYQTQIGRLVNIEKGYNKVEAIIGENKNYCIIVPGSLDKARRWEEKKFVACIAYILSRCDIYVVLSGAEEEIDIGKRIKRCFAKENRVVNLIGKTALDDLIHIISNSRFVLGNDTGTIHLAATLSIPSVCIMSYKEKGFHPYIVDYVRDDDKIPVGIWAKNIPACAGCRIASNVAKHRITWKNEHCRDNLSQGKPFYCLSQISVEDVTDKLDLLLEEIK